MEIENKIKELLEKVRPFLVNDGGNLEFVRFENGTVYIKMLGACSHCSMIDVTLKEGIESMLVEEIPEVREVVRVEE